MRRIPRIYVDVEKFQLNVDPSLAESATNICTYEFGKHAATFAINFLIRSFLWTRCRRLSVKLRKSYSGMKIIFYAWVSDISQTPANPVFP